MVDRLDPAAGPTEAEVAFVKAYLADGPMDPALLARAADPERLAERTRVTTAQRLSDWPNLGQYRHANTMVEAPVRAVFLGDSLTEFWTVADPEFFTGGIVGRGISGQTSPQLLLRFMADVVALKPQCVHILVGANDVAGNTGPSTPQDYRNTMLAMIALAKVNDIRIILGGLPAIERFPWAPHLAPRDRMIELDTWLRATAQAHALTYADYPAVLTDPDGGIRADFTRDGVHPTARGYAAMRPVAEQALAITLNT